MPLPPLPDESGPNPASEFVGTGAPYIGETRQYTNYLGTHPATVEKIINKNWIYISYPITILGNTYTQKLTMEVANWLKLPSA